MTKEANKIRPAIDPDTGEPTITTYQTVTREQGSWRWQRRLQTAYYRAVYSKRLRAWIWRSYERAGSFSGGNIRGGGGGCRVDGSLHNRRLSPMAQWALSVVRGEV